MPSVYELRNMDETNAWFREKDFYSTSQVVPPTRS